MYGFPARTERHWAPCLRHQPSAISHLGLGTASLALCLPVSPYQPGLHPDKQRGRHRLHSPPWSGLLRTMCSYSTRQQDDESLCSWQALDFHRTTNTSKDPGPKSACKAYLCPSASSASPPSLSSLQPSEVKRNLATFTVAADNT